MMQHAYSLNKYHINASLVPRPSNGGDEKNKGLVFTACTCAVIIQILNTVFI